MGEDPDCVPPRLLEVTTTLSPTQHTVPSRYAPDPQDLLVYDGFDNARKHPDRVAVHSRVEVALPMRKVCFWGGASGQNCESN